MEVGRIEALLTAKFDSDPFDKYERAITGAKSDAAKKVTADLDGKVDTVAFDKYGREIDSAQSKAKQGATARLDAKADTTAVSRYNRSLDDADGSQRRTERGSKGLSGAWAGLAANAKMLAGGAGVAALAVGFRAMYTEQAEAQQVGAQTVAVLKSTGGAAGVTRKSVEALSAAIGEKAALDDEAVQSGANLLLTFTNVQNQVGRGNDIFDRAVKTTADVSRAFGKDMPAASIMMGKALNDPIAGVSALSRVGIQFTDQQKDQIKAMVESGDTLGAQKKILKELEKQVGGSAAAYGKTLPGAVDRTKNAFNNLMEDLGEKVAPAVSLVADGLTSLLSGKGFGGGLGETLKPVTSAIVTVWNDLHPVLKQIGDAFTDTFSGSDMKALGKDVKAIMVVIGAAVKLAGSVMKRQLEGMAQAFRGVLLVIRGVVRVIGGILRGDWSEAWKGAKDIVRGALNLVIGMLKNVTAPIREAISRLFDPLTTIFRNAWNAAKTVVRTMVGSILDYVRSRVAAAKSAVTAVGRAMSSGINIIRDIPGKVRDVIGSAVDVVRGAADSMASAGASIGSALISGVMDGISATSGLIADIGSSIASWINSNTVFGDTVKIGPVSATIPALAMGGPVGPNSGGPRVFIAGEGNKDEWVISQEGDRGQNIEWARQALEQLTGKPVDMHKKGMSKHDRKAARKERAQNAVEKRGTKKVKKAMKNVPAGWQGYLSSQSDAISRMEREYGQMQRTADFTEEEFLIDNDDGSITIDTAMVNRRLGEIKDLKAKRQKIIDAVKDLIQWIRSSEAPIKRAIKAMTKAAGMNGDANYKSKYRTQAATYQQGLNEMMGAIPDLLLDNDDNQLDLQELNLEEAGIGSLVGKGPDPVDPDNPDTGSAATPEQIAAAAAAQLDTFNTNRSDLFGSFGQNFIGAGGQLTSLTDTAGLRFFGAGQSDGAGGVLAASGGSGAVSPSGSGVSIVNNYAAPPDDPHTWSQGVAWEIRTAVV